ncbi:MAG: cytochrome P450 [Chloroflexota bacterium]
MSILTQTEQLLADPYPLYQELRVQPSFEKIENPLPTSKWAYVITRYDDVSTILKDRRFANNPRVSSNPSNLADAWWTPKFFKSFMSNMLLQDNPDHMRLRNLVHKAFSPKMIKHLDSEIQKITERLLDEMEDKGTVDLMADFALPLPLIVIAEMMGVPEEDLDQFHQLSSAFVDQLPNSAWGILRLMTTFWTLERFFRKLISAKTETPADDLVSALVQAEQDGERLSEDELVAMLFILLLAGHETTVNLIGNGVLALIENPDQLETFKQNPGLVGTMTDELLRYTNPVQHGVSRYATEDIWVGNNLIRKGDTVLLYLAAANRDESVFENPDQLDITRQPNKHLAFGLGAHYCIGAPLAKLEAKWAFTMLFERFPDLELAIPADQLEWRETTILRGLKSLPIKLT